MYLEFKPPLLETEKLDYLRPIEELIEDLSEEDVRYPRLVFNQEVYLSILAREEEPELVDSGCRTLA